MSDNFTLTRDSLQILLESVRSSRASQATLSTIEKNVPNAVSSGDWAFIRLGDVVSNKYGWGADHTGVSSAKPTGGTIAAGGIVLPCYAGYEIIPQWSSDDFWSWQIITGGRTWGNTSACVGSLVAIPSRPYTDENGIGFQTGNTDAGVEEWLWIPLDTTKRGMSFELEILPSGSTGMKVTCKFGRILHGLSGGTTSVNGVSLNPLTQGQDKTFYVQFVINEDTISVTGGAVQTVDTGSLPNFRVESGGNVTYNWPLVRVDASSTLSVTRYWDGDIPAYEFFPRLIDGWDDGEDQVLVNNSGDIKWVDLETFTCP